MKKNNMFKGFNRLFIILALLSIFPGFMLGAVVYKNIVLIEWQPSKVIIRYGDMYNLNYDITKKEIDDYKIPVPPDYRATPINGTHYGNRYEISKILFIPITGVSSLWSVLWGITASILSYFIVLYFLKGLMFVIGWIIAGFKGENSI
jgi:hypothetical protein